MNCDKYIIIDRGNIIARGMPIETAIILLKALLLEYHADTLISYTLEREPYAEVIGEEDEDR